MKRKTFCFTYTDPTYHGLGLESSHVAHDAFDATLVDDDAMVFSSDQPGKLIPMATKAITIIAEVYHMYQLKLNFSKGKSEAIVAHRGKDAKKYRIQLAIDMQNKINFAVDGNPYSIAVVHRYRHLGTIVNINGSIDAEIKYRSSNALAALRELRQQLKLIFGLSTNLLVVRLFVVSRLLYGAQSWPVLSKTKRHGPS